MGNFGRLSLGQWRQFAAVDIDLSKQVTILTGQNGCGKTTILTLLSRHFGWNLAFVSTPFMKGRRAKQLWSDLYDNPEPDEANNNQFIIGSITYEDGRVCNLASTRIVDKQYNPDYQGLQAVEGLHIPSHRGITTYSDIQNIPTQPVASAQQYQQFQGMLSQAYGGGRSDNAGKIQKQSLIALALLGEGNKHVVPNPEMRRVFAGFQAVLKAVLPDSLGFLQLEIRLPEVVLVTKTGTFSLDAMSGGISAIFSIAWQIYMFGYDKDRFTITIDEPENHLHPTMQRTFLPKLARAFPRCRLIAATHSPFIVSSFADANVVALTRDDTQKIVSTQLDLRDISGTPNEVLREILDVGSNLPVWVEAEVDKIIARSQNKPTDKRANFIMQRLKKLGISDAIVDYKRRKFHADR